jgi:hypothetical protein
MIPDRKFIKGGGRANPPGIPYLYLANTPETALAEMRPWVGESLTLAIFETQRPLSLVLCRAGTENESDLLFDENPPKEKVARITWSTISREFARPINRQDQESAYLPTQILAEVFKAEGFDGVAYQSGLERGINVALFDPTAAKLMHRFVYTLKKLQYHFEGVPYFTMCRKGKEDRPGTGVYQIHTESPPSQ